MNESNPLSALEKPQQFQAERYHGSDGGFCGTELYSDYLPGPYNSLTPVVLENAKEIPGLSTATSQIANMSSESNHEISDFLTLQTAQPITDQNTLGEQIFRSETQNGAPLVSDHHQEQQTSQDTPEFAETEAEEDFLLEVKIEEEEPPEEIIDMSSFTDGIYICEVGTLLFWVVGNIINLR